MRVFHDEDFDTGMSFLKLNEVGPATTEAVDNEIKRILQVCIKIVELYNCHLHRYGVVLSEAWLFPCHAASCLFLARVQAMCNSKLGGHSLPFTVLAHGW